MDKKEPSPNNIKNHLPSPYLKCAKGFLWAFSLVFGTLFVTSSALILTLLSGNIDLTQYKSYGEKSMHGLLPNHTLELGSAYLSWDRKNWSFSIHAQDARLKSNSLKDTYSIPKMHVSWPLLNILTFQFQPVVIELIRPKIKVRNGPLESDDDGSADLSTVLRQIVQDSPVEKIIISEATVDFKTQAHGQWKLNETSIVFKKEGQDISGSFVTHLEHIGKLTGMLYTRESKPRKMKVAFKDINPKIILNHPYLQQTPFVQKHKDHLSDLNVPFSGVINLYFSEDFQVERGKFLLDCGKGTLKYAPHIKTAIPVDGMTLKGDITKDKITLKNGVLKSPLVELNMSGFLENQPTLESSSVYKIHLQGSAQGANFSQASSIWPEGVGTTSRSWILKNIPKGDLKASTLDLKLRYDPSTETTSVDHLTGTLSIENASLLYMDGLPPIENMTANAVFNKDTMTLDITKGNTYSQAITAATIKITGLQEQDQFIHIDLSLDGSAQDALRIINVPRLKYATKYGLTPKTVKGKATSHLTFHFPLGLGTTLDQVDLTVETKITDGVIPNIITLPKVDLSEATLELKINKESLTLEGTADVNGAPSKINWWENHESSKDPQATLKLTSSLGKKQFTSMGLNMGNYITGSAPLTLSLDKKRSGLSDLQATLDLKAMEISIPEFRVNQPQGVPGKLTLKISLKEGLPQTLSRLILEKGPALKLDCTAQFAPQTGNLKSLNIQKFTTGRDTYSGKMIRLSSGLYSLLLTGSYIDLHTLIESRDDLEASFLSTTPFKADIKFNKAEIEGKPFFKNFSALLENSGTGYIRHLNLQSQLDSSSTKPENCTLKITTQGQTQKMTLHLDDLGTALSSFGAERDLKGGKSVVHAKRQISRSPSPWEGTFKINNFVVLKAPVLMNLLKVINPMSVMDIFSKGNGLKFQSLSGGFVLGEETLLIKKSLAVGPSIGMTIQGEVQRKKNLLNLRGTVIPAYILNSVISYIPIIGQLLAGDAGEGVVAIPYTITGPVSSPNIQSHPLGAVTPGILRKMFESPPSKE